MRIKSLSINYFRSIKSASIIMHDITAIVGENNAGKTAILRAINAVMNYAEEEESFRFGIHRYAPKNNTQIQIEFCDIPDKPYYANKVIGDTLTILFKYSYSKQRKFIYVIMGHDKLLIDDDFMSMLATDITYVYIPSNRTDHDITWENDSILNKVVSGYVAKHTEKRDNISKAVKTAAQHIHNIALRGLEKEINHLYMHHNSIDFQLNFSPNIDYSILLDNIMLSINEYGSNYMLKECGSGTKSLTVIAMHRANALRNKTSIVLGIEEPETNLHPQAQKCLIMSLRDNRHDNETQAIFTTHSTVLIDTLKHENIVLVRRRPDKRGFISHIRQLPNDFWNKYNIEEYKHYQYFNYKNSDFFFARYIIIGESKNDCQVFESLIQSQVKTNIADISFLDAGGVGSIPYPFFLLKELEIPFVLIVDKDFFFRYINNELSKSRNTATGLPKYSPIMNSNPVLDDLFPTVVEKSLVEQECQKGYRAFFEHIKRKRILSMNYCLDMDLTCSKAARLKYYEILHIAANDQTQKHLLCNCGHAIKKIENLYKIINGISQSSMPESFQKIKNYLIHDINEQLKS